MKMLLANAIFLLCAHAVLCQNQQPSLETLEKENTKLNTQLSHLKQDTVYLRSKLKYFENLNAPKTYDSKPISNNISTTVLSCLGDRDNQTVTVEFVISHKLLHQSICIATDEANVKAFDDTGTEFPLKAADLGATAQGDMFGSGKCNKVPTDVPLKGRITFRNVTPGTEILMFITAAFKYRNYDSEDDYLYGTFEIKNLKIHW
jgi:hypothetical protein